MILTVTAQVASTQVAADIGDCNCSTFRDCAGSNYQFLNSDS